MRERGEGEAKGERELYRDCFDGLIREPNGKLQRPTLACWVRFHIFSVRQRPVKKRLAEPVY